MPGDEEERYTLDQDSISTPPPPANGNGPTLGWLKDPTDENDFTARALFGAPRGLPREASLASFVPVVRDQFSSNSCVGQSMAAAIDIRHRKLGRWQEPLTSESSIYTFARVLARATPDDPLLDIGCYPRKAARGVREWGIVSREQWPLDESTIDAELPLDVLMTASAHRLTEWRRIDTWGQSLLDGICQAISAGFPVPFGLEVDAPFLEFSGKDILGAPGSDRRGGHMLLIVAYRTNSRGRREFLILNSWGSLWGDGGFVWVDEEFVLDSTAGDFYIVQLG